MFAKLYRASFVRNVYLKTYIFRKFSQKQEEFIFEYLTGKNEGIAIFGFNRSKQKNALGSDLLNKLNSAIDQVCFDSKARVVILRSFVPGVFCAGADLKERLNIPPSEVPKFVSKIQGIIHRVHKLPVPVIAALDGLALGGGLELALACDMRISVADCKLGLVETRLAIIPGGGGTQRLPRLINPAIAKELIYTARIIDGNKAKELGLVNHVVNQNETNDAAYQKSLEIAQEILPNGPVAIRMAKTAINRGIETDIDTGLMIEEACYGQLVPTQDRTEGVKAFNEKRKPNYIGQ